MLLGAVSLLERHDVLRKSLISRFRWLLVDEYQDTNLAQARLVWLLGGKTPNLTAVGDEDQSIYRWRGAEVENILNFEAAYPTACIVTLGRNYRSAEPILRAAAAVIERNSRRRPKKLSSEVGSGAPVVVYLAADEADEARFVADEIGRLRGSVSAGEIAVLFRVNAQSRPFEAEMVRRAMPYVVVGGTRFWERKEVRDALAYLRLLVARTTCWRSGVPSTYLLAASGRWRWTTWRARPAHGSAAAGGGAPPSGGTDSAGPAGGGGVQHVAR